MGQVLSTDSSSAESCIIESTLATLTMGIGTIRPSAYLANQSLAAMPTLPVNFKIEQRHAICGGGRAVRIAIGTVVTR